MKPIYRRAEAMLLAVMLALSLSACVAHTDQSAVARNATGAAATVVQDGAATLDRIPPCIPRERVNNESPIELLNLLMWACAERGEFEQALFLYALGGVDGYYDALRVADPSSHGAASLIREVALQALATHPERYLKFNAYVNSTLNDNAKRQKTCDAVRSFGPPSYLPQYMVDFGVGAIRTGAGERSPRNRGLVENFDVNAAWSAALNEYLHCDTVR